MDSKHACKQARLLTWRQTDSPTYWETAESKHVITCQTSRQMAANQTSRHLGKQITGAETGWWFRNESQPSTISRRPSTTPSRHNPKQEEKLWNMWKNCQLHCRFQLQHSLPHSLSKSPQLSNERPWACNGYTRHVEKSWNRTCWHMSQACLRPYSEGITSAGKKSRNHLFMKVPRNFEVKCCWLPCPNCHST